MSNEIRPIYDKKVNCLYCEESFMTKRIRSRFIRIEKVHSDFYQEFKDPALNPYFYEVDVCPTCGFAASENFSSYFPLGSRDEIAEKLSGWRRQDFGVERNLDDGIQTIKLGLLSGILKKEKHIVIAGLCLRLSWLYRIKNVSEEEQRFLKEALNHYKLSYEQMDYLSTKMTELRLLYMVGELSRRVGDEEEAVRSFSRVIQHKHKELEPKTVEMAREQWYLIRNQEESSVLS